MNTHTPGPWSVGEVRLDKHRIDIDAPHGDERIGYVRWESLARVYGCEDVPIIGAQVMDANARLIAASPDLYAAAVSARAALSDLLTTRDPVVYADALRLLDAAIDKVGAKR